MKLAKNVSELSKDPSTKVGAVLVTPDNRQHSIGYNGFPVGIKETSDKWERPLKYEYVIHAEVNAILNAQFKTNGCKVYCTHEPCHRCLGVLLNSGIKNIYYGTPYERKTHIEVWEDLINYFDVVERVMID
jgi:dCMP deaminase